MKRDTNLAFPSEIGIIMLGPRRGPMKWNPSQVSANYSDTYLGPRGVMTDSKLTRRELKRSREILELGTEIGCTSGGRAI